MDVFGFGWRRKSVEVKIGNFTVIDADLFAPIG